MIKIRSITLTVLTLLAMIAPATLSPAHADSSSISLEQLKLLDLRLRGPSDATFFGYTTPAHWALALPTSLELDLDVIVPGDIASETSGPLTTTNKSGAPALARNCVAGTLSVSINESFLGAFQLPKAGLQRLSVPFNAKALIPRADGGNPVYLAFESSDRCGVEQYAQIYIRPTSRLLFNKTDVEPQASLKHLPRPIVQNTFEPDQAVLVLPDKPSASELEAGLNVAAGFARMTGGALVLTTTTISRMTEELWSKHQLILVGKPAGLPIISLIKLPQKPANGRFTVGGAQDGIIQIGTSPYNRAKSALVISGNSDAGVAKAGRAISSGAVRARSQGNLAIIADTGEAAADAGAPIPDLRTLADLGFADNRAQGSGSDLVWNG